MNLLEYKETYGRDAAIRLAESAGTNYAYYKQMMRGHRRPSIELARRLVIFSNRKLDLLTLLGEENVVIEERSKRGNRLIPKKSNRPDKQRNKPKARN